MEKLMGKLRKLMGKRDCKKGKKILETDGCHNLYLEEDAIAEYK